MRRSIATAALAAGVLVGAAGATLLSPVGLATAQEQAAEDTSRPHVGAWIAEALEPLVAEGTISQTQADAVNAALVDAVPERRHPGGHLPWDEIAAALGMTTEELRAAMADGNSIAEIAAEQGVDLADIVDLIIADMTERLAAAVADGALTQERADEILANAEERVTAFLNGERPERPEGRGGRGGRFMERRQSADSAA